MRLVSFVYSFVLTSIYFDFSASCAGLALLTWSCILVATVVGVDPAHLRGSSVLILTAALRFDPRRDFKSADSVEGRLLMSCLDHVVIRKSATNAL